MVDPRLHVGEFLRIFEARNDSEPPIFLPVNFYNFQIYITSALTFYPTLQ
jgi:hypothetical protein